MSSRAENLTDSRPPPELTFCSTPFTTFSGGASSESQSTSASPLKGVQVAPVYLHVVGGDTSLADTTGSYSSSDWARTRYPGEVAKLRMKEWTAKSSAAMSLS